MKEGNKQRTINQKGLANSSANLSASSPGYLADEDVSQSHVCVCPSAQKSSAICLKLQIVYMK